MHQQNSLEVNSENHMKYGVEFSKTAIGANRDTERSQCFAFS